MIFIVREWMIGFVLPRPPEGKVRRVNVKMVTMRCRRPAPMSAVTTGHPDCHPETESSHMDEPLNCRLQN